MKEYIFDEKASIEKIINAGIVDNIRPTNTIKKLSRYNYFVNHYGKAKNYACIVEYMSNNYKNFSEFVYQKTIKGCIRDVNKTPWKDIEKIDVKRSEIDVITRLSDIREQKITFVLLCMAKYKDAYSEEVEHKTDVSVFELFKLARVVLPKKERLIYLNFLVRENLVKKHTIAGAKNRKLTFVSDNINDEVVISINEIDFQELAYLYMDYVNNHVGYGRCEKCGRIIKHSKTKPRKYCSKCSEYEPVGNKIITCADCGKAIIVDAKNNKTYRCESCQHLKQLEYQRNAMAKSRM